LSLTPQKIIFPSHQQHALRKVAMPAAGIMRKHHVTLGGNPQASAAMVFVHGFGTDQTAWRHIEPAFADRFRTVRFDNVGAGLSDPDAFEQQRYLGLDGYARDLVALLDSLRLYRVVLVGHSIGAMICLLAAIERPSVVQRVVMIGATPHYMTEADYPGGMSTQDRDAVYRTVMTSSSSLADLFAPLAYARADRPDLVREMAEVIRSIPDDRILTILCSILQSDHRADLPRLAQPSLLIQSSDDAFVPRAVADYLHASLQHSTLVLIDATGHLPHVSAPKKTIEAMQAFVDAALPVGA
jgi:sigma-B regulation protein RsbQ